MDIFTWYGKPIETRDKAIEVIDILLSGNSVVRFGFHEFEFVCKLKNRFKI